MTLPTPTPHSRAPYIICGSHFSQRPTRAHLTSSRPTEAASPALGPGQIPCIVPDLVYLHTVSVFGPLKAG